MFVLLGLIYTVTVPVFEAPDEPWHFNYVRYVAQGRGLPSMRNNDSGAYQEVGQPPLYYLIAGLVTAPVSPDDLRGLALHNPGFGYQAPGTVNDNKNLMAHTEREAFPWRGAAVGDSPGAAGVAGVRRVDGVGRVGAGARGVPRLESHSVGDGGDRRVHAAVCVRQQCDQQRQFRRRAFDGDAVGHRANDAAWRHTFGARR